MRFLLVDDEKLNLQDLKRVLSELYPDAEIICASGSREAYQYREENFTVLFLDIRMPGEDGIWLAKEFLKVNNRRNIVFLSAYDEYALKACNMQVSGYLLKPADKEDILDLMSRLRYPEETAPQKVTIRCFGRFEVFYGDEPIHFERKMSKEILAYLVHNRGAFVTRADIASILWEDSVVISKREGYLRSVFSSLLKDLESYGIKDLIIKRGIECAVNTKVIDCDYYRYLDGDTGITFHGVYMEQYSWAEEAMDSLNYFRN